MSLKVHYPCIYYPQWAHDAQPRDQDLWDSYKFCTAVKTGEVNGHLTFPTKIPTRIDSTNVIAARQIFGKIVLQCLSDQIGDVVLVPVPSKDSFDTDEFRSLVMLRESLPKHLHQILPILKYHTECKPAHQGGSRDYTLHKNSISVVNNISAREIVLIDDIVTSGSSLQACRDLLVDAGHSVRQAIVCGKTDPIRSPAFSLRSYELADRMDVADIFK